jgi:hypothetical protein
MSNNREFWITNLTNRDVALADLRLTVPAFRSINILDPRHYHLSVEQIETSLKNGSLFRRKGIIVVRDVPPKEPVKPGVYVYKGPLPGRRFERPIRQVEDKQYEELQVSTEKFAAENVDMVDENKPILEKKR